MPEDFFEEIGTKNAINNLLIMYLPPDVTVKELDEMSVDFFSLIAMQWQNFESRQKENKAESKAYDGK